MIHDSVPDPDRVVRYDIHYFDFDWVEIEELASRLRTAHQMIAELDVFNQWHQSRLRGATVELDAARFPWVCQVEVCLVEV